MKLSSDMSQIYIPPKKLCPWPLGRRPSYALEDLDPDVDSSTYTSTYPDRSARDRRKMEHMADDVVREILLRVSTTDIAALFRFRCAVTCKRWRALVTDRSFLPGAELELKSP